MTLTVGCGRVGYDATAGDGSDAVGGGGADAVGGGGSDAVGADGGTVDQDGGAQAACAPGKVSCDGVCIDGANCTVCLTAKLLCKPTRTCVSRCADCFDVGNIAVPIECFACAGNDPPDSTTIGTCESAGPSGYCLDGDYSTAFNGGPGDHCDCNGFVAACAGSTQTCVAVGATDYCSTCGEPGSHGRACKGGGSCNAMRSPPACE